MIDVENLMVRLTQLGMTVIIKTDRERFSEDSDYWTIMISGGHEPDSILVRTDERSLNECLRVALRRLSDKGEEWSWVEGYIEDTR